MIEQAISRDKMFLLKYRDIFYLGGSDEHRARSSDGGTGCLNGRWLSMSFANSGFNPLAASGLGQLLGVAQSIVPESFGGPSGGYGVPVGYGSGYAGWPGGGYGVPAGYGAGYAPGGGYGMPAGYGAGYAGSPAAVYTVTQTTYQQTYYGAYPADPYGMGGTMAMPVQGGWGGGYYAAYY